MSTTKSKTILVVDDDPDFILQQRVQLEAAGFEVLAAENSVDAIKTLQNESVDLAAVDLMIEKMDAGLVLCHQIKKNWPQMPVILITGVTAETGMEFDTATEEERSWIKADAMLAKPIRLEQLTREINRLLKD